MSDSKCLFQTRKLLGATGWPGSGAMRRGQVLHPSAEVWLLTESFQVRLNPGSQISPAGDPASKETTELQFEGKGTDKIGKKGTDKIR